LTVDKISNAAQGINNIWFSGAWLGYGFHEDGVKSALKVRELINAK
jgi:predicted NAD/FAD-binding protein